VKIRVFIFPFYYGLGINTVDQLKLENMLHKNLEVWKRSIDLVIAIYNDTKRFPSDERFCLSQQMRRAAVSIPSNIAEGSARKSTNELRQFLFISLGSLAELETQVIIASKLGYSGAQSDNIEKMLGEIRKMLQAVITKLS
jgi:four helix bundle protein